MRRLARFAVPLIAVCAASIPFVLAHLWPALAERHWQVRYATFRLLGRVDPRCTPGLTRVSMERWTQRQELSHRIDPSWRQTSDDGLTRWDTPSGPVWTPPRAGHRAGALAMLFHNGPKRWAQIDSDPDAVVIQPGDTVIDAGAHIGDSAIVALRMGARLVIAIEPDPDNLRALRRNLAQSIAAGRAIVVEKGVYDRIGFVTFVRRENSWDGEFHESGEGHDEHGDELPVTTIDQIVHDLALSRVNVIKMDIEGSEVPALRGAAETLRRDKPRLLVGTYHRPTDLMGVEETVRSVRADYNVLPSICVEWSGRWFPNLLYFR